MISRNTIYHHHCNDNEPYRDAVHRTSDAANKAYYIIFCAIQSRGARRRAMRSAPSLPVPSSAAAPVPSSAAAPAPTPPPRIDSPVLQLRAMCMCVRADAQERAHTPPWRRSRIAEGQTTAELRGAARNPESSFSCNSPRSAVNGPGQVGGWVGVAFHGSCGLRAA